MGGGTNNEENDYPRIPEEDTVKRMVMNFMYSGLQKSESTSANVSILDSFLI